MNVALHTAGSSKIAFFLRDAMQDGTAFSGSNGRVIPRAGALSVLWTTSNANPVLSSTGGRIGWDKNVSELVPSSSAVKRDRTSHSDMTRAVTMRAFIADKTPAQIDAYIDANVTNLATARDFLKLLSKVVLALCKLQDA